MMKARSLATFIAVLLTVASFAQDFYEVQGTPISNTGLDDYWTGAAWIDVDGDERLDLFLTNRIPGALPRSNKLFLNKETGFVPAPAGSLVNTPGFWFGNTWGDYNNDGLTDVFVAGFPSGLFRNTGGGQFERASSGAIASATLAGIGAAWGDFNNDGYLDLICVRPDWIQGPPSTGAPGAPHLMINSGPPNYSFTRLTGTALDDAGADTYLHPTLSDYDDDGDLDIFIGMGSGMSKKDLLFRNLQQENGTLGFERIEGTTLSEALLEGNQWSFEDIDNDGDLDAYVTNWANYIDMQNIPRPNNLYRNDGGSFTEVDAGPITSDESLSTTACWGDYDNDGDLDVVTVSDSTYLLRYYQNDGNGNFTSIPAGELGSIDKHQSGATAGDYDNDGDLDLFIPGPGGHNSFLNNGLDNGNNWVKFALKGTASNATGIGAKLWLYATIGGQEVIQRREVSGASTFFGTNSLVQHFGLGSATAIDSLVVHWPSGHWDSFYGPEVNTLHELEEGSGGLSALSGPSRQSTAVLFPNPGTTSFTLYLKHAPVASKLEIHLFDAQGRPAAYLGAWPAREKMVIQLSREELGNAPAGLYFLKATSGSETIAVRKMVLR